MPHHRPTRHIPGEQRPVAVVATHIAPATGFGGVAECVARVVRCWAEQRLPVSLCASNASTGPALRPGALGLPAGTEIHLYRSPALKRHGFGLGAIDALLRCCLGARAVYVNGLTTWPTTLAKLICVMAGRPMLVGLHAGLLGPHVRLIRAHKPLKWAFYLLVELPLLRRAAAIHATSQMEARDAAAWLPGIPIHVVPNGVDFDEWPAQPPRQPDGGLNICYIGRFSPEKGILAFAREWLHTRRPHDRLLIAGDGDGPYAQQLRDLADSCPDGIEMHGYLPAEGVRALLARSDLLALPSGLENGDLRENFGNVVVEALACARPVLVTAGTAWEMAEQEGFGLIMPADPARVAGALARSRSLSSEELAEMGTRGRRYAMQHFAIGTIADKLWHIAENLTPR